MMTKEKLADLQAQGQKALDAARQLEETAKSENRGFNPSEQRQYDDELKTAAQLVDRIKTGRHDLSIIDQAKELSQALGESMGGGGGPADGDKTRRLSFAGVARQAANRILDGSKAGLSPSGAALVGQEFRGDPYVLGRPRLSLLDALPVVTHSSPEYAFLRQTTRDSQAAVVATGALKPTSDFGVTRIEQSLQVLAHVASTNRMWLLDNTSLTTFLETEMTEGLQRSCEAKVLADINATSGLQLQAYATSVLATLRKSITKCQTAGHTPSSFVLHPTDWEGVELALSSTNSVEHQGLPYNPATQALFGVPVVVSLAEMAGVGHLLAVDSVALDTDQRGIDISWSESATADSFQRNIVHIRVEARYGTSVYQPAAVVSIDLTA